MDVALGLESVLGEIVIERKQGEPEGFTAFSGRAKIYPNVADDATQHRILAME